MISDEDQDVSGLIEKLEKDAFYGERNLEDTRVRLAEAEARLAEAEEIKRNLIEREEKIIKKAEEEAYRIIRGAKNEASDRIKEIKELINQDKSRALEAAALLKKDLDEKEGELYGRIIKGGRIGNNCSGKTNSRHGDFCSQV